MPWACVPSRFVLLCISSFMRFGREKRVPSNAPQLFCAILVTAFMGNNIARANYGVTSIVNYSLFVVYLRLQVSLIPLHADKDKE